MLCHSSFYTKGHVRFSHACYTPFYTKQGRNSTAGYFLFVTLSNSLYTCSVNSLMGLLTALHRMGQKFINVMLTYSARDVPVDDCGRPGFYAPFR